MARSPADLVARLRQPEPRMTVAELEAGRRDRKLVLPERLDPVLASALRTCAITLSAAASGGFPTGPCRHPRPARGSGPRSAAACCCEPCCGPR